MLVLIKYCQCYLACLERIVEYINRNAYIQIAIGGKSFCAAIKDAFSVISSNFLRFTAVSGLGAIFNFIGVVFIAAITTLLSYILIKESDLAAEASSPYAPCLIIFIIAIFIARPFMHIYGQSMDAILHAFLLDEKINKE